MDLVATTRSRSDPVENHLTIGALGKATNTKTETIRYCEHIGLLPAPDRTAGYYRAYGPDHLRRLSFIRRSRDLGFSIEARNLLSLADQKEAECGAVDGIAREHLAEIERKIGDLTALRRELRDLIGQCGNGMIAECRLIEALSPARAQARSTARTNSGQVAPTRCRHS